MSDFFVCLCVYGLVQFSLFPVHLLFYPAVYALYVMHILMFYESFQAFGLQKDKKKKKLGSSI